MSEALQQEIRHLRSLEGSPRDPDGRIFLPLADAHLRAGEVAEAERLLADGLARHPEFVAAHVLAARVRLSNGDEEGAEMAYAAARRLDPENVEVLHGLGSILAGRGEEIGIMLVERARELDPTVVHSPPASPPEEALEEDTDVVSIADLAPVGGPVVSIAELAPDADEPVVSIAALAPDAESPSDAADDVVGAAEESSVEASEASASREDGSPGAGGLTPLAEVVEALAGAEVLSDVHTLADAEALADADTLSDADALPDGDTRGVDAAAAADDVPGPAPARRAGEGGLATRTLAELLVAQGQKSRAIEMYERLVAAAPADSALAERLAELREDGGASSHSRPGPETEEEENPSIADYLGGLLGYTPSDRPDGP